MGLRIASALISAAMITACQREAPPARRDPPVTPTPQPGGCRDIAFDGPCTFAEMRPVPRADGGPSSVLVRHRAVGSDSETHTFDTVRLRIAPADEAKVSAYYAEHSPIHCAGDIMTAPCPPQIRVSLDLPPPPYATVEPP